VTWEDDVRLAGQVAPVQPKSVAEGMKKPTNSDLWLRIAGSD
jgi:hypothetical protein